MFEIGMTRIHQHEDTTEWGNDEPYLVIFAADLADISFIPVPAAASTLNGPFDIGGVIGFPVSEPLCWGFDGNPRDITNADDVIILVLIPR